MNEDFQIEHVTICLYPLTNQITRDKIKSSRLTLKDLTVRVSQAKKRQYLVYNELQAIVIVFLSMYNNISPLWDRSHKK